MVILGTAKIGFTFGPIIFVWFCTLAMLGIVQISQNPIVLKAINPYYAFEFLYFNGWHGYALLGGIFLVVTGGEALYADIGHLGKNSIRLGWFAVALPGLLLNYFGQGSYLLGHPSAIANPFYLISPSWFSIPLLIIATMATIIASQAVISATFSSTKQAVLLGLYPRLPITQTSESEKGQIYVPQMNFILAVGTMDVDTATYLIEIPNIVASRKKKTLWFYWQEKIFAFLMRNYSTNLNVEFYQLPYNRTIAISAYFMI